VYRRERQDGLAKGVGYNKRSRVEAAFGVHVLTCMLVPGRPISIRIAWIKNAAGDAATHLSIRATPRRGDRIARQAEMHEKHIDPSGSPLPYQR